MWASWCREVKWKVLMVSSWILSRVKWQSSSICLDISWKKRLVATSKVVCLSQNNWALLVWQIPKLESKVRSQSSSQVVAAIEWYFTSTDDPKKVDYILIFHETKELSRYTQYPEVDLQLLGDPNLNLQILWKWQS